MLVKGATGGETEIFRDNHGSLSRQDTKSYAIHYRK